MADDTYTNFQHLKTEGHNSLTFKYHATIDVTTCTGMLWWKKYKVTTKEIRRDFGSCWFFVDTGIFTPGIEIETLARSFKARTGIEV